MPAQALYTKYRPRTFDEIEGQEHIKTTLKSALALNRIAHAYLFTGPRGTGKTTTARVLAKAVNCLSENTKPCNQCATCQAINEGRMLDLIEIDAASNTSVDDVRDLRDKVDFRPGEAKFKVYIIDEVHMLTTEAFNALLKTLEEPPAHAIFILATTELHQIPETIISRCQRFDFRKVSFKEIVGLLEMIAAAEKVKVSRKVIETVARISEGYVRDAISLLGQILAIGEKEITEEEASLVLPRSDFNLIISFIRLMFLNKTADNINLINQYLADGGELENFAKESIETLRKILVAKVTDNWQELAWEIAESDFKLLADQVEKISVADLVKIIEILIEALTNMKRADITQLPLELAVVKIGQVFNENK
jgi:DNA polymerase-3 subunit gamma/tau